MKKILVIVGLLINNNLFAETPPVAVDKYLGKFAFAHDIAFLSYDNEEQCTEATGRWNDGVCLFDTSDYVEVTKNPATEKLKLTIGTVRTNAHTCDFESENITVSQDGTFITATEATQAYNTATERFTPSTCFVKVTYSADNAVEVSTTGACDDFCGIGAMLDIRKAIRE